MKIPLPASLGVRQVVLLALTAMVALSAAVAQWGLLPAWATLRDLRSAARLRGEQYAVLSRNLALRHRVAEEFHRLAGSTGGAANDEVALSDFLRDLETKARLPGLSIVNIKPLPVRNDRTHKVYSARLTLSGRLGEVLKFACDVGGGSEVTGVESFSIRGTQKLGVVECGLSLRRIGLAAPGAAVSASAAVLAGKDLRRGIE